MLDVQLIKSDYLLYHQNKPIYEFLKMLQELDSWEVRGYYNNEKDEYYGLIKETYAVPLNNKYRDNDASGHHSGGQDGM